jgi:hypothetical protein
MVSVSSVEVKASSIGFTGATDICLPLLWDN